MKRGTAMTAEDLSNLDKADEALCLSFASKAELSQAQSELIALAAGGKSPLDRSPKHNWVEDANGLPKAIEELAVELTKKGKSVSSAIAIAISQAKRFAVSAKGDKRAKWVEAVAQWDAMKAATHAKNSKKAAK